MFLLLPALISLCSVPPPAQAPYLLLLGDSNMHGALGEQLEATFANSGWRVRRFTRSGSGLARPDYWDWQLEGAAAVSREAPDAVVIIVGGNDAQVLWKPNGAIKWKDEPAWRAEYAGRLQRLLTTLGGYVRPVYLLSPTNRRSRKAGKRLVRVRDVQQQVVAGLPLTRYVDTWTLTSDLRGHYVAAGPREVGKRRAPYRHRDGIHLTRAGARALLPRLLEALARGGLTRSR